MSTSKLIITALTVTLLGSGAAYAKGGNNGNSADHGARGNDNGRNERGVIASDLKWRNAAHSFKNGQAYLNADPDSAVGLLAELVNATNDLNDGYFAELGEYYDEDGNPPRSSGEILGDIDAAEDDPDFDETALDELYEELWNAEDYEVAKAAYEETVEFGELNGPVEDAEAGVALDELEPESITALWELLLAGADE